MKTVAVIGLGPSGLASVKELKEAGFDVQGFDRCKAVGGRWNLEGERGVWKEMCLNINRRLMSFSDFPWTKIDNCGQDYAGHFAHCTEMKAYTEAYTDHFDLRQSLQLETEVKNVQRQESGGWVLTTKHKDDEEVTNKFDALVVCSGMLVRPYHPLREVFHEYTGELLHSAHFRSTKDYKKKRVLVIGSSFSGGEISTSLANDGDCEIVSNSVRHVPYHIAKISHANQICADSCVFMRMVAWLNRLLPESIGAKGFKATVLANWPDQITPEIGDGMEPDPDIRIANISVSTNYVENVKNGKIKVKPAVASAEGRKVTFQDGTSEEFDVVICATGYETEISFLPKEVQDMISYKNVFSGAQEVKLYKHTLVPAVPDLAFVGVLKGGGPYNIIVELQARYVAAMFSGKIPRLSRETMEAGIKSFCAHREQSPFYTEILMPDVCEELGDELGVTPSFFEAFWDSKKLVTGPLYPCTYRLNPKVEGEEKAKRSRALLDEYAKEPQIAKF